VTTGRRATILSPDGRWVLATKLELASEVRASVVDVSTAIAKVDEWCDDPMHLPDMIDFYEEVTGNRLSPPTIIDIPKRVKPALLGAIEDGLLAVVKHPMFRPFEARKQEGVHGQQAPRKVEEPTPLPRRRPLRRVPEKERIWVDIVLADRRGKPVAFEPFEVVSSDGRVFGGRLTGEGEAEIDDLSPGQCEINFPELDGSEWLPGVPPNEDGAMHVVEQGEHAASIAADNSFRSFDPIWDHPKNAALRARRSSPNVLAPGDEIFIPLPKAMSVSRSTVAKHKFILKRALVDLRLRLQEADATAFRGALKISIEGREKPATPNADGVVTLSIEATDQDGILQIEDRVVPIEIGSLDPVSEPTGVDGRLINLGYLAGPAGEATDRERRLALEEFQLERGLQVTGTADETTRAALVADHGA
jgi:hypothetical protein